MWALYPWFEEHGAEHIHPEDLARLCALGPYGKVFSIDGDQDEYKVILYGKAAFRVKPDLLKEVSKPMFQVGDRVRVRNMTEYAIVVDVLWHHGNARHFYHVAIGGKRKGTRYWEEDLEGA